MEIKRNHELHDLEEKFINGKRGQIKERKHTK